MPDNDISNKEKRQAKRNAKLDERVLAEKERLGISDKTPKVVPFSAETKAATDKQISDTVEEKERDRLTKFQQRFKAPEIELPNQPLTDEQLKKSLRREKRARLGDIVSTIGRGMQGKEIDPSKWQSTQIRKEREGLYDTYKTTSQAARQRLKEWDAGYRKEQRDWLDSQLKDPNLSELKRIEIEQEKAKLDKILAETKYIKNKPYYKPTSKAKQEMPVYTYKTNDGQTLKMELSKEDANMFNQLVLSADKMKRDKEALEKQMNTELYSAKSERWLGFGKSKEDVQADIRAKYQGKIDSYNTLIGNEEERISEMFAKDVNSNNTPPSEQDDMWEL